MRRLSPYRKLRRLQLPPRLYSSNDNIQSSATLKGSRSSSTIKIHCISIIWNKIPRLFELQRILISLPKSLKWYSSNATRSKRLSILQLDDIQRFAFLSSSTENAIAKIINEGLHNGGGRSHVPPLSNHARSIPSMHPTLRSWFFMYEARLLLGNEWK
ncbi:hypothetical protein M422DRAFT_242735 [Sphaerobolus stellatus SS14]|nr:hypothetical protein M422DRAFT_242735 [Sphaerobolus stellatus SS14]